MVGKGGQHGPCLPLEASERADDPVHQTHQLHSDTPVAHAALCLRQSLQWL